MYEPFRLHTYLFFDACVPACGHNDVPYMHATCALYSPRNKDTMVVLDEEKGGPSSGQRVFVFKNTT